MNIQKRIENEKRHGMGKIFFPLLIMAFAGYFLYVLIKENFFMGWEVYFAIGCYAALLTVLIIIDFNIIRWMCYSIYIEKSKLKIKDGLLSRLISIPMERIYYISSTKAYGKISYDSILITDKKVTHRKIRLLSEDEFKNTKGHIEAIRELGDRFPDKIFYYYRVHHHGYKFLYYLYMLYKNCERCKFSDASMELVKIYANGKC